MCGLLIFSYMNSKSCFLLSFVSPIKFLNMPFLFRNRHLSVDSFLVTFCLHAFDFRKGLTFPPCFKQAPLLVLLCQQYLLTERNMDSCML